MNFGVSAAIAIVLFMSSHLVSDRDFDSTLKTGVWIALVVVTLLFVFIGVF